MPALCFVFACAEDVDDVSSGEDALLPNGAIFDVDHDGTTYKRIAEHFASRGLDQRVALEGFAPSWPLSDTSTAVLNRFGTPVLFAEYGYYHTGFDVLRSDPSLSTDVLAPVDGLALTFDWSGARTSDVRNAYATVVAIYDPASHVITQIMHVAPTTAIAQATEPVAVKRGEVIGQLAKAPLEGPNGALLQHASVVFVDGENQKLLDPATLFADYKDSVAPTARAVYVASEDAKAEFDLVSGQLDVVVDAFDRDDHSERNLEVSAIAFTIKDQDGNVLSTQPRCSLDHLYESIAAPASFRAKSLIDFGTALPQAYGAWPNSDVGNESRSFRYALTQLAVVDGRCTVRDDTDGFVTVGDAVTKLEVSVTLWDAKGNQAEQVLEIARPAAPPEPPPAPVDGAPQP